MTFQSKARNYTIVIKPSKYQFDNLGNRVFVQGVKVNFENNLYKTDDPEIIDALKKNAYYGIDFWALDEPVSKPTAEGEKIEKIRQEEKEATLTDCPICGKTFKTKGGLFLHNLAVHKDKS